MKKPTEKPKPTAKSKPARPPDKKPKRPPKRPPPSRRPPGEGGKGARREAAARKRAAYFAARARGLRPYNALIEAGYHPGGRRAATAMGGRLDRSLSDAAQMEQALVDAGVTRELIAEGLLLDLLDDDGEARRDARKIIGRWMRLDRPREDAPPDPTLRQYDEVLLAAARQQLAERLDAARRDAPAPDGGPARGPESGAGTPLPA